MARPEPAWRPPPRDGLNASRVAVGGGSPARLLDFLAQRLPAGEPWAPRLQAGEVLDARGRALQADSPVRPGDLLWYWRQPAPEPPVPFEIEVLHQDAHLVVVDKPHFLPVTPGGRHVRETVLVRLQQRLGLDTLAPMHRLDRETAGLVVFTVQPATRGAYQGLLRDRRVHKVYEAVAPWRDDLPLPLEAAHHLQEPADDRRFMQMQVLATGPGAAAPNAFTRVELLAPVPGTAPDGRPLALYRLTPHTGRKHQLRAQMNALGLPIVGDRIYPRLLPQPPIDAAPDYRQPLQLLARRLSFDDPLTGQPRVFTSRRQLALAPWPNADADADADADATLDPGPGPVPACGPWSG